ncbi:MAG: hypothetical protein PHP26_05500 [Syntrophomonas sp.]|nr:hypothetical protein [Syntrophomonas sp.]
MVQKVLQKNLDSTAKSHKYYFACINIPLAVYAWATPAACLAAQGVCANLPSMVVNLNSETRRVLYPCFANARFVYLCNPYATKGVFAVDSIMSFSSIIIYLLI